MHLQSANANGNENGNGNGNEDNESEQQSQIIIIIIIIARAHGKRASHGSRARKNSNNNEKTSTHISHSMSRLFVHGFAERAEAKKPLCVCFIWFAFQWPCRCLISSDSLAISVATLYLIVCIIFFLHRKTKTHKLSTRYKCKLSHALRK